jgi:phage major head subunit gpT-like protein
MYSCNGYSTSSSATHILSTNNDTVSLNAYSMKAEFPQYGNCTGHRVVQKMTSHLQWQKKGAKVAHEIVVYQTKAKAR